MVAFTKFAYGVQAPNDLSQRLSLRNIGRVWCELPLQLKQDNKISFIKISQCRSVNAFKLKLPVK